MIGRISCIGQACSVESLFCAERQRLRKIKYIDKNIFCMIIIDKLNRYEGLRFDSAQRPRPFVRFLCLKSVNIYISVIEPAEMTDIHLPKANDRAMAIEPAEIWLRQAQ